MTIPSKHDEFYTGLGTIFAQYHGLYHLPDQGNEQSYTDPAAQSFARYLRAARRNAGLSEIELAEKVKPGQTEDLYLVAAELFALEHGLIPSTEIRFETLTALANALEEDISDFASLLERELPTPETKTALTSLHNGYKAATAYFGSTKKLLLVLIIMVMGFVISMATVYVYISALTTSEVRHDGPSPIFANSNPPQTPGLIQASFTEPTLNSATNISRWLLFSGMSIPSYFQVFRKQILALTLDDVNQIPAFSMVILLLLLIIWIAILRGDIPLILASCLYKWQRRLVYITPILSLCVVLFVVISANSQLHPENNLNGNFHEATSFETDQAFYFPTQVFTQLSTDPVTRFHYSPLWNSNNNFGVYALMTRIGVTHAVPIPVMLANSTFEGSGWDILSSCSSIMSSPYKQREIRIGAMPPYAKDCIKTEISLSTVEDRTLAIYTLTIDNQSTGSSYYGATIQAITDKTSQDPKKIAVILADNSTQDGSQLLVIHHGNQIHLESEELFPTLRSSARNITKGELIGHFIRWARTTFPANQTYLTIVDSSQSLAAAPHVAQIFEQPQTIALSSGSSYNLNHPDFTGYRSGMISPHDLVQALDIGTARGENPLDVLDITQCFSANIEDLYHLSNPEGATPYAEVMISSPNYTYFAPELVGEALSAIKTGQTVIENVQAIVQTYSNTLHIVDEPNSHEAATEHPRTMVAVKSNKLPALRDAIDQMAASIIANSNTSQLIADMRIASPKYDTSNYSSQSWELKFPDVLVDVTEFSAKLLSNQSIKALSNQAIVACAMCSAFPWFIGSEPRLTWKWSDANGISLYTSFQGAKIRGSIRLASNWNLFRHPAIEDNDTKYSYTFLSPSVHAPLQRGDFLSNGDVANLSEISLDSQGTSVVVVDPTRATPGLSGGGFMVANLRNLEAVAFWADVYINPDSLSAYDASMESIPNHRVQILHPDRIFFLDSVGTVTATRDRNAISISITDRMDTHNHDLGQSQTCPHYWCSKETLWTEIWFAISRSILIACLFSIVGLVVVREGKMRLMLMQVRKPTTRAKDSE